MINGNGIRVVIILILLCFSFLFTYASSHKFTQEELSKITYGMKKEEIKKIFGEPDEAGFNVIGDDIPGITKVERWDYETSEGNYWFIFDTSKKLIDWKGGRQVCYDGWEEECYLDSTKYKEERKQIRFSIPKETVANCFAFHSLSRCANIEKFRLKKRGEFKDVSSEEFYKAIKEKNKSCNDCLIVIRGGCC